jgi:pSer/pThr/pTyr-binding forkhead associated (FHA) protein
MPFLRYEDTLGIHYYELGAKERVVIGRDKSCDIVLNDTQSSRQHCEVKRLQRGFLLNDLHSRNGTKVNGNPISSWTLKEDDMITVGGTCLVFRSQK